VRYGGRTASASKLIRDAVRLCMQARRESAPGPGLCVLAPGLARLAWLCTVIGGRTHHAFAANARRHVCTCKSALTKSSCVFTLWRLSMPAARGHVHGVPASHKLVSFASTSTYVTLRSGPHTANTYCCESSVMDYCHRSVSTPSHPQLTQTAQGRHAASVLEGRKHHHRVVAAKAERVGDAGGNLVRLLHVGHGVDVRHLVHQVVLRARGMLIRSNQNRWCCAVVAVMVHQAVLRARGMLENQTFIPGAALGWQSCLLLDHQPFCIQNGMHVSAGDDGSSARACTRYG